MKSIGFILKLQKLLVLFFDKPFESKTSSPISSSSCARSIIVWHLYTSNRYRYVSSRRTDLKLLHLQIFLLGVPDFSVKGQSFVNLFKSPDSVHWYSYILTFFRIFSILGSRLCWVDLVGDIDEVCISTTR